MVEDGGSNMIGKTYIRFPLIALLQVFSIVTYGVTTSHALLADVRGRYRNGFDNKSSISTFSNVEEKQPYSGCYRKINGKYCGSKCVEGSVYCYNCKQIVESEIRREVEEKHRLYEDAKERLLASSKKEKQELARLSSAVWCVSFEPLIEKHKRIMENGSVPKFEPDGLVLRQVEDEKGGGK